MRERIVSAAIQYQGVTISLPLPARHAQVLHCAEQFLPEQALPTVCQGFLTSEGRFVNRVQARQIAFVAGQEPKTTGNERDLFSEDLW
ncbi:hypothetical protein EET67_04890 [Pseudaminobacter arsenicus]|uniref:Uncharacterized protein n=1 Tax=Borborobacter arsenicus TaxID=1851146 RepID=A0A432VA06_9HYPH|nr:hypothetical protein [Pseudaminobacter arsenicus]RUM98980.1 hypothetical protein EET67_04890 [Pseudaminobacter arsenicus]